MQVGQQAMVGCDRHRGEPEMVGDDAAQRVEGRSNCDWIRNRQRCWPLVDLGWRDLCGCRCGCAFARVAYETWRPVEIDRPGEAVAEQAVDPQRTSENKGGRGGVKQAAQ